jgi:hypothetical protein
MFHSIFKDLLTNLNVRFWFFSKRDSWKLPTYQTKLTSFEKILSHFATIPNDHKDWFCTCPHNMFTDIYKKMWLKSAYKFIYKKGVLSKSAWDLPVNTIIPLLNKKTSPTMTWFSIVILLASLSVLMVLSLSNFCFKSNTACSKSENIRQICLKFTQLSRLF